MYERRAEARVILCVCAGWWAFWIYSKALFLMTLNGLWKISCHSWEKMIRMAEWSIITFRVRMSIIKNNRQTFFFPTLQIPVFNLQSSSLHHLFLKPLSMGNKFLISVGVCLVLTLSSLATILSRRHFDFVLFSNSPRIQDLMFHANRLEEIWIKCQILFSGKMRKYHQFVVCWISLEGGNTHS